MTKIKKRPAKVDLEDVNHLSKVHTPYRLSLISTSGFLYKTTTNEKTVLERRNQALKGCGLAASAE